MCTWQIIAASWAGGALTFYAGAKLGDLINKKLCEYFDGENQDGQ